jgi:hypothetical protein
MLSMVAQIQAARRDMARLAAEREHRRTRFAPRDGSSRSELLAAMVPGRAYRFAELMALFPKERQGAAKNALVYLVRERAIEMSGSARQSIYRRPEVAA